MASNECSTESHGTQRQDKSQVHHHITKRKSKHTLHEITHKVQRNFLWFRREAAPASCKLDATSSIWDPSIIPFGFAALLGAGL